MFYKILADIVVLIHFLWILFLVFGVFLGVKNRPVRIFHISVLAFAFVIQIFDWYCPLTHLEAWLRTKHDPSLAYKGSFIIYYVEKMVYIELSRNLILILTVMLCGLNAWLYLRKKDTPYDINKSY